nr:hypothetical protein [Sulfidibacter corallicola]
MVEAVEGTHGGVDGRPPEFAPVSHVMEEVLNFLVIDAVGAAVVVLGKIGDSEHVSADGAGRIVAGFQKSRKLSSKFGHHDFLVSLIEGVIPPRSQGGLFRKMAANYREAV